MRKISKEDFRILINGKLIAEKIEPNKKVKIQFETINHQEIEISVHSNRYSEYHTMNYNVDQFPKTIQIDRSTFNIKSIIMGKIAYPRPDSNQNKK